MRRRLGSMPARRPRHADEASIDGVASVHARWALPVPRMPNSADAPPSWARLGAGCAGTTQRSVAFGERGDRREVSGRGIPNDTGMTLVTFWLQNHGVFGQCPRNSDRKEVDRKEGNQLYFVSQITLNASEY